MHEKCHFLGNLLHYNWLKIKKLYVLCRFWYTCIILLTFKISTILYIEFVWLMKVFFYQNLNKGRIITFLVVGGGLGCHLFPFNFLIFNFFLKYKLNFLYNWFAKQGFTKLYQFRFSSHCAFFLKAQFLTQDGGFFLSFSDCICLVIDIIPSSRHCGRLGHLLTRLRQAYMIIIS